MAVMRVTERDRDAVKQPLYWPWPLSVHFSSGCPIAVPDSALGLASNRKAPELHVVLFDENKHSSELHSRSKGSSIPSKLSGIAGNFEDGFRGTSLSHSKPLIS